MKKGRLWCSTTIWPETYHHSSDWCKTEIDTSAMLTPEYAKGKNFWTDGKNIYCSFGINNQYVLIDNKLEVKTWDGFSKAYAAQVWTDGNNIYTNGEIATEQYVLNGDTWEPKTWGIDYLAGAHVWSDGNKIFHSAYTTKKNYQYVLNGDTWESKTWNGFSKLLGYYIWSDGNQVFYSRAAQGQYVLNGDTWEPKTWNGLDSTVLFDGNNIWSDGNHVYFSGFAQDDASNQYNVHYVLNGDTWEPISWTGVKELEGLNVWFDGTDIRYSAHQTHYVLEPTVPTPVPQLNPAALMQGYMVGQAIRRNRK